MNRQAPRRLVYVLMMFLVVALVACGGGGGSDDDDDDDEVPANNAPVSDSGADQAVLTCALAELDASGSTDEDGDALTYAWTLTSKPSGSMATLEGATTQTPSFTPDLEGAYVASLVASDGEDQGAADTVTLTASSSTSISFATNIQPVFTASCVSCHGGVSPSGPMSLESGSAYATLVQVADTTTDPASGFTSDYRVLACDAASSTLYQRISALGMSGSEVRMPQGAGALSSSDISNIQNWIDAGAPNN